MLNKVKKMRISADHDIKMTQNKKIKIKKCLLMQLTQNAL